MREKKWTPGPWGWQRVRDTGEFQIVGDGWGITNVAPLLRAGGCVEGEANAHLIAAAPDLVEALDRLRVWALDHHSVPTDIVADVEHALVEAYGETT